MKYSYLETIFENYKYKPVNHNAMSIQTLNYEIAPNMNETKDGKKAIILALIILRLNLGSAVWNDSYKKVF